MILENRSRIAQRVRDSWMNKCHFVVRPLEVCVVARLWSA
jgi:hypothetical protein